ncbi:hypothetical protein NQ314_016691 [Rhamnusium bicolor]|uniref:Uncharacterized protein n=1 Tax=Rhamnusium bicolor TaxID=1586634 RepID=A0AAV8WWF3_9CUCU|nr:hypothetical protein NQ314_016691 [Rhamnusium bicolor]
MRLKLPSGALACDRTGVSDRAAAIIANAVLEDIGMVSKKQLCNDNRQNENQEREREHLSVEPVRDNLPKIERKGYDLSTDQRYLLEIVQSIESGSVSASLASRNPGKLSHARWFTTANRILRLYVASENPSESLRILVNYVMKVYGPFWFRVKLKPSCVEGTRHLFSLIEACKLLPKEVQNIIYPVIQRNGFSAHPKNILLSLLTDENKIYKELGIRRVLKAPTVETTEMSGRAAQIVALALKINNNEVNINKLKINVPYEILVENTDNDHFNNIIMPDKENHSQNQQNFGFKNKRFAEKPHEEITLNPNEIYMQIAPNKISPNNLASLPRQIIMKKCTLQQVSLSLIIYIFEKKDNTNNLDCITTEVDDFHEITVLKENTVENNNLIILESTSELHYLLHDEEHPQETESESNENTTNRKGRKKVADPETWGKNVNKKMRMLGKDYIGYKRTKDGVVKHDIKRSERAMGPACKIRQNIFETFWAMNWEQKKLYVLHMTSYHAPKRSYTENPSRRTGSFDYFLKIEVEKHQKGHTQMECDSSHSLIERHLKGPDIFLPTDYISVIRSARRKPKPLDVQYLYHSFFLNYEDPDITRYKSLRPGKRKNDLKVADIKYIKYVPSGEIFYKANYKDGYESIPQRQKAIDVNIIHYGIAPISETTAPVTIVDQPDVTLEEEEPLMMISMNESISNVSESVYECNNEENLGINTGDVTAIIKNMRELDQNKPRKSGSGRFDSEQKCLKEAGKAYKTRKLKDVAGKALSTEQITCKCKFSCKDLEYPWRKVLFEKFYNQNSKGQGSYLMNLIHLGHIKRRRHGTYENPVNSKGQVTIGYTIPTESGNFVSVCKATFINTFAVTKKKLDVLVAKKKLGETFYSDKRTCHKKSKFSENNREAIRAYINLIPRDVGHYTRTKSDKEYLSPDLNDFPKLSFRRPRLDTCHTCDQLDCEVCANIGTSAQAKTELELYQRRAERARDIMKEDTSLLPGSQVCCLSMALEQMSRSSCTDGDGVSVCEPTLEHTQKLTSDNTVRKPLYTRRKSVKTCKTISSSDEEPSNSETLSIHPLWK